MQNLFKYPRTYHLPYSEGATSDDKMLKDVKHFELMDEVVVTVKMDGENTTWHTDHFHARSLDSKHHDSRDMVKSLWSVVKHDIPTGWRICGENLYARHSIGYDNLSTFFMVFNIWNENNECLSWDDTVFWCKLLDLQTVPVLYRGKWNEKIIRDLWSPDVYDTMEGYVVRNTNSFAYEEFGANVGKFVRNNHVTSEEHWKVNWVPNKLKL